MTASTSSVSPLRQRMLDDMRMRKLSPKTQIGYIRSVRQLAAYLKRSPDTATAEELRSYQLYLIDHGTSAVSINNALSGLKFLYEQTLDRPELMRKMQSVPVPHKLPVVLSRDEVARLLAAVGNLKHQTALSAVAGVRNWRPSETVLALGAGMRAVDRFFNVPAEELELLRSANVARWSTKFAHAYHADRGLQRCDQSALSRAVAVHASSL